MGLDDKALLRQRFKAERDALSLDWRAATSQIIAEHLMAWRPPQAGEAWGLYAPLGSEVLTAGLAAALRLRGVRVFYPKSDPRTKMLTYGHVAHESNLFPGVFGVLEPAHANTTMAQLDVVVTPGLAFDRSGARLGYGGGYYDRTLPQCTGLSVGFAFASQVQSRLPVLPHDQRVHALVTEQGVIQGGS